MALSSPTRILLLLLGVCLGAFAFVVFEVLRNPSWRLGVFMTGLFVASSALLRKALTHAA